MTSLAELGEISKAKKSYPKEPPSGYRESYLSSLNPTSQTYVKEGVGSGARRVILPAALAQAGAIGGSIAGARLGKTQGAAILGGSIGSVGGLSAGLTRNIRSKDTISYHKKTGRKARYKLGAYGGLVQGNAY